MSNLDSSFDKKCSKRSRQNIMKNIIGDMFCYKKDTYFVYYVLMTDIDIDDIILMVVFTNFSIFITDYSKQIGAKIQFCVLTIFKPAQRSRLLGPAFVVLLLLSCCCLVLSGIYKIIVIFVKMRIL